VRNEGVVDSGEARKDFPVTGEEAMRGIVRMFWKSELTREKVENVMVVCLPVLDDWLKEGGNQNEFLKYDASDTEVDDRMWRDLTTRERPIFFPFKFFGGRLRLGVERKRDSVSVWLDDPKKENDCMKAIGKFDRMCGELFGEGNGVVTGKDKREYWLFRKTESEMIEGV